MKWRLCLALAFIASTSVVLSQKVEDEDDEVEHRERRQSHLGGSLQFVRPPLQPQPQISSAQLLARSPPGPPVAFHLLQNYRPDDRNAQPPQQVQQQQIIRTTQAPPPVARTRAPQLAIPTAGPRVQQQQQQSNRRPQNQRGRVANQEELAELVEEAAEELEEDKPDRLTLLLPLSKFDCVGRGTGYYADEELECEVFHYCQSGARHSWICPEGFTFHQVHLICMPPGGDNICKKSSQFHFVNEYLYRPINAEEAQTKPNVTLRYADRYYPETYDHLDDQQGILPQPVRQRLPASPQQRTSTRPAQTQARAGNQQSSSLRPQHQFQQRPSLANQVFHSPEEVNIPLQHRRPIPAQQRVQQKNYGSEEEEEYDYDDQPAYRQG